MAEYMLYVRRDARTFYMVVLWLPPIFLTVLALSTFWMSPEVGERLGYGITILLASQFGKAVVMEFLPVCKELLWIDIYLLFHEVITFCILVMSCVTMCASPAPHTVHPAPHTQPFPLYPTHTFCSYCSTPPAHPP